MWRTLWFALLFIYPASAAQGDDLYQELVHQGVDAQAVGDFAAAHEAFAKANDLYANARSLRAMGIASFLSANYVVALTELEGSLSHPERPLDARLREGVLELVARARQEVSVIHLTTTPASAQVFLDEATTPASAEHPLVMTPGTHTIRVVADGCVPQELRLTTSRGDQQKLHAVLVPLNSAVSAPPAGDSEPARSAPAAAAVEGAPRVESSASRRSARAHRRRMIAGWVSAGTSLAAGLSAATFYAVARQRVSAIGELCRSTAAGVCSEAEKAAQERAAQLVLMERGRKMSLVLAATTATAALTIVGWDYFTNGRRLDLWLSTSQLGARVRF